MRRVLRWTWLGVIAALLYAGGTLLLRWKENRDSVAQAEQERARADLETVERLGGGELKILSFYANPPVVARGAKGLLCYGVSNAASVKIEPGVEDIAPSLSRCVEVRPTAATKYTLTALDDKGRSASQSIEVVVR